MLVSHVPVMNFTYFTARLTEVAHGENCYNVTCRKCLNGPKIYDSENIRTTVVCLSLPRGNIHAHVY